MKLKEKIENDFLIALKNKEERLSILRMLKAACQNAAIEKRTQVKNLRAELEDEEIVAVLRRQVKQLEEARMDFQRGGRLDLVGKAAKEIEVLKNYLPVSLSEAELEALVKAAMNEIGPAGPNDFGKVMGAVMKKVGGKVEGEKVKEIVTRNLQNL